MENEVAKINDDFLQLPSIADLNQGGESDLQGIEFTLDRIVLPTGGGISFKKSGLNGVEEVKELVGVIIYQQAANTYYKDEYNGQKNPPDCYSSDGLHGNGNPGGDCKKCPYNVFGSGKNGVGKQCKNKRVLYFQIANNVLPYMIYVPVGSIANFNQYMKVLLNSVKASQNVVTKITLKTAKNQTGIDYSEAQFEYVRDLTKDEINRLTENRSFVKNYAATRAQSVAKDSDSAMMDGFVDMETGEKLS
ncbi:MAG: hypothetical protein IKP66_06560 [Lachnospiraceae bacterium]|nr:hypothetical protein [Lachnospiraceae bacterium]